MTRAADDRLPGLRALEGVPYDRAVNHHAVDEEALVALVSLALGRPCRTDREQRLLVETCERIDNVFTPWSERARQTWEARPCERCGRAVPRGEPAEPCRACFVEELADPDERPRLTVVGS